MTVIRGRLRSQTDAPEIGERVEEIARLGGIAVEHILSGALPQPVDYDQDHDEWVVVLHGDAVVVIDNDVVELGRGDWLLLPAHVPHRLVRTTPGTSWLALHAMS